MAYVVGRSANMITCSECEQDLDDLELNSEKPYFNFRLVFNDENDKKNSIYLNALGLKL
jgi:hypothetical protein